MLPYILKRIAGVIPTLFVASIFIFLFIHFIPGDPVSVLLGDTATPEEIATLSHEMGFDRPLYIQYIYWITDVLQGDLGRSIFFQEPVVSVIADGAETSVSLALITMIWVIILGISIGVLSSVYHGTWIDQLSSGGAMFAASIPTFWLGLYLILVFAVGLGWFPTSGFPSMFEEGGIANLRYLVLPSLALAAPNAALIIRLVRASMLDVQREDHVRTARAKGLHPFRVVSRHIFRNALII